MVTKMKRRIVTDGKIFRIQCSIEPYLVWTFYQLDYPTLEAAKNVMDKWNLEDAESNIDRWSVVND